MLIHAAAGATGSALLALAKHRGARTNRHRFAEQTRPRAHGGSRPHPRLHEREARSLAVERGAKLDELRRQIAEKQRAEEQKRTATRWRRHFTECQRLSQGVQALDSLGYCDAQCEAVVSRMQAEQRRLRAFEYTEVVDDPSALSKLVGECRASGCEVCP